MKFKVAISLLYLCPLAIFAGSPTLNPTLGGGVGSGGISGGVTNNQFLSGTPTSTNANFTGTFIATGGNVVTNSTVSFVTSIYASGNIFEIHNASADSTFVGLGAGSTSVSGPDDVMIGNQAGQTLSIGSQNTVEGQGAFANEDIGEFNVAIGTDALRLSENGNQNASVGAYSMSASLVGTFANSAFGFESLQDLSGGSNNIAIGALSAINFGTTESSNIDIGNTGITGDQNIIRIGQNQKSTFIAGVINGNGSGLTNGSSGLINNTSQTNLEEFQFAITNSISVSTNLSGVIFTNFNTAASIPFLYTNWNASIYGTFPITAVTTNGISIMLQNQTNTLNLSVSGVLVVGTIANNGNTISIKPSGSAGAGVNILANGSISAASGVSSTWGGATVSGSFSNISSAYPGTISGAASGITNYFLNTVTASTNVSLTTAFTNITGRAAQLTIQGSATDSATGTPMLAITNASSGMVNDIFTNGFVGAIAGTGLFTITTPFVPTNCVLECFDVSSGTGASVAITKAKWTYVP